MKQIVLTFFSLLFITIISGQQKNNFTKVDFGYVDKTWTYHNEGIGISFTFPKGAYYLNYLSNPQTYVKKGAALIKIRGFEKAVSSPINEFKKNFENRSAPLFAFTVMNDSAEVISKAIDFNADKTFYVALAYATDTSTYHYLLNACTDCTKESFERVFKRDIAIGNTKFDAYVLPPGKDTKTEPGVFFGIKKIRNLYLVVQYNFTREEELLSYREYLKSLTVR